MPFTDVIDDYTDGATGTLTDASGDTVNYTVTGTAWPVDWNALTGGASVSVDGSRTFTVTFNQSVLGATMQISGSDSIENYFVEVDGVTVNLQTLLANGDVTFNQSGAATHTLNADGSISGGVNADGSIAELVFNIPVTSLGAYGGGGAVGPWDYFEVGIESTTFDVVCYARNTHIQTAYGERPIEDLMIGDTVMTAHNGAQTINWVGSRKFNTHHLAAAPRLRPVCISSGALGQGLPLRDLRVSRQHRMVVSSAIAERLLGCKDVMVAAIKLTELPGIYVDEECDSIEYIHLLLDEHDVIFAEGAPSESLYCGGAAFAAIPQAGVEEICEIFPEFRDPNFKVKPALPFPSGKEQKQLVKSHLDTQEALLAAFA